MSDCKQSWVLWVSCKASQLFLTQPIIPGDVGELISLLQNSDNPPNYGQAVSSCALPGLSAPRPGAVVRH